MQVVEVCHETKGTVAIANDADALRTAFCAPGRNDAFFALFTLVLVKTFWLRHISNVPIA